MGRFTFPVIITALGLAWLLKIVFVEASIDWVWVILLIVVGGLLLIKRPLERVRLAIGLWMLIAAVSSILRQSGLMAADIEVPILIIAFGLLAALAQALPGPEQAAKEGAAKKKEDETPENGDPEPQPAEDSGGSAPEGEARTEG